MIVFGDILLFKRNHKDKVSSFLSWVLQKFEPDYDREFWHTAIVSKVCVNGCYVLDAMENGVEENFYTFEYIDALCRVFQWFDTPPPELQMYRFVTEVYGAPYDRGAYVGTVFFYLINKVFKKQYRVHDVELTCWELVSYACRKFGKPLQARYEYPTISSMQRTLEANEDGR